MRRFLKLAVVVAVMGLLALATAVPAFARGPGGGLGRAVHEIIDNAADKGANDIEDGKGLGTHNAVCFGIEKHNPLVPVGSDQNCIDDPPPDPPRFN